MPHIKINSVRPTVSGLVLAKNNEAGYSWNTFYKEFPNKRKFRGSPLSDVYNSRVGEREFLCALKYFD